MIFDMSNEYIHPSENSDVGETHLEPFTKVPEQKRMNNEPDQQ